MRIFLLIAAIAAAVAFAWHFGRTEAAFGSGFWLLSRELDYMIILATIGLCATRVDGQARWITVGLAIGLAVLSAFLTRRGLELPDVKVAVMIALLILGAIGASGGKWLGYLAPFAALAALLVGHAATDARPSSNLMFLAGFVLASATLVALGAAIAEGAERLDGGLARRVAAGVAGVGAYLLTDAFLL